METTWVIAVVLVALTVAGAVWLHRRHRQLVGDDPTALVADAGEPLRDEGPAPVLDRDALLARRRPFNPAGWDDTPDDDTPDDHTRDGGAPAADDGAAPAREELPTYLDREFLARRERKDPPG